MQFDPEDECSPGWKWYVAQLTAIVKERKPFDLALFGHDHSLQLIEPSEKGAALARFEIISGAGAKTSVVRGPGPRKKPPSPTLERVYTASTAKAGESRPGFVGLKFYADRIHVQFFDGWRTLPAGNMAPLDETKTWEGKSCFVINDKALDPEAGCQW